MSQERYDVVFHGDLFEGFSLQHVKEDFARLFSLTEAKVEQIFARTLQSVDACITLKPNVDQPTAEKYQQALANIGAKTQLQKIAVTTNELSANQLSLEPMAPTAAESETADTAENHSERSTADASLVGSSAASVDDDTVNVNDAAQAGSSSTNSVESIATPLAGEKIQEKHIPFQFHGNGTEYFKIWIVNVVLTILTLGIYSAWAKVRNQRYFYGNTELDGATFTYTAKPLAILIGRIIAVVLFVGYTVATETAPMVGLAIFGFILLIMPWIIVRSLRFNARNSVYRNIRFGFEGGYGRAFLVFLLLPILSLFTLMLVYPIVYKMQQEYLAKNHRYGTTGFSFNATNGDYYVIFLIALAIGFVGGIAMAILAGITGGVGALMGGDSTLLMTVLMVFIGILYVLVYLSIFVYFYVARLNLLYNNTQVGEHSFTSSLQLVSFFKLFATNTIMILLTLGLFTPWAKVRTARYRAEHLQLLAVGSLDEFVAKEEQESNAIGEEMGEVFDFDVGF